MRTETRALRRLLVLGTGSAVALLVGSAPAFADNGPHVSTTNVGGTGVLLSKAGEGRCASCHRAHTAQSAYLLKAAGGVEGLCYSCHGDGGTGATTDVQSGIAYGGVVGALRGGGFANAAIDTAHASKDVSATPGTYGYLSSNQNIPVLTKPVTTTSAHIGGTGIMWGNGAISSTANAGKDMSTAKSGQLECTSCHNPHGNGQYRILNPVPVDSGFATITANTNNPVDTTTGVPSLNPVPGIFIKDTGNKVYTTTNYWISGDPAALADTGTTWTLGATTQTDPTPVIGLNSAHGTVTTADSFSANVAAWCTTCHTRYLAPSGSANGSSGDAIFTYRHRSDSVASRATGTTTNVGAYGPNCVTCHVAHGSNAAMPNSSVKFPDGTGPSADSRLLRADDRGVCVLCHSV